MLVALFENLSKNKEGIKIPENKTTSTVLKTQKSYMVTAIDISKVLYHRDKISISSSSILVYWNISGKCSNVTNV